MINVEYENTGSLWAINILGHAGYAPKGQDVVCSAVSLLTTMIAQILSDEDGVKINTSFLENGSAYFEFDTRECPHVDSKMMAIYTGFQLLNATYGDYVSLSSKFI